MNRATGSVVIRGGGVLLGWVLIAGASCFDVFVWKVLVKWH